MKLNQTIAITNGEKSTKQKVLSKVYQVLQKKELFEGLTKRYSPFEDDPTGANKLPDEDKKLQMSVSSAIKEAKDVMEKMFNIVATQDIANCEAKGTIKVDDKEILKDVPVTHLLFLEKQLTDIKTFIGALPTLDPVEEWTFDNSVSCFKSKPKETIRTKNVLKNHVKAEATKEHPAQVDVYKEDVPVGKWTTIKFSGCIEKKKKDELLDRVNELDKAVKIAREEANSIEVKKSNFGTEILDFIFLDV